MARAQSLRALREKGLWLIGGFKLVKGLLLVALGIGALHLVHRDVADVVAGWLEQVHVDPGRSLRGSSADPAAVCR